MWKTHRCLKLRSKFTNNEVLDLNIFKAITPKLLGLQECELKPMDGSVNTSYLCTLVGKIWKQYCLENKVSES